MIWVRKRSLLTLPPADYHFTTNKPDGKHKKQSAGYRWEKSEKKQKTNKKKQHWWDSKNASDLKNVSWAQRSCKMEDIKQVYIKTDLVQKKPELGIWAVWE